MSRRWPLLAGLGRRRSPHRVAFFRSFVGAAPLLLCWTFLAAALLLRLRAAPATTTTTTPGDRNVVDSLRNFESKQRRDDDEVPADRRDRRRKIYVVRDPDAGTFAASDWKRLSRRWDGEASYADLLEGAPAVEIVASMMGMPSRRPEERVTFVLHTHPKMASTTLRRACWENLRSTCDVASPRRDPMGYSDAKDLAALMDKCSDTHHFCVVAHHFLLYNYSQVHATLAQLGRSFRVPTMPYADMNYKRTRQDGSCPTEILTRFHECFDEVLLEL